MYEVVVCLYNGWDRDMDVDQISLCALDDPHSDAFHSYPVSTTIKAKSEVCIPAVMLIEWL